MMKISKYKRKAKIINYYTKKYIKNIKKLNKDINNLNFMYKKSFNKNFYLLYDDIHDLSDYRLNIELNVYRLGLLKQNYLSKIDELNNQYVLNINNVIYYQILLNKLITF